MTSVQEEVNGCHDIILTVRSIEADQELVEIEEEGIGIERNEGFRLEQYWNLDSLHDKSH